MIVLTPASCEAAWSKAYERGLRDAARIFAGFELSPEQLSSIAVDAGFGLPLPGPGARRIVVATRGPGAVRASTRRSTAIVRRGQARVAEADRIAELRSDRTGNVHEVVRLSGGRYGVRKVAAAKR